VILVEIKSHISKEDVYVFKRKADFYEKIEMKQPSRLLMVTPYIDEDALKVAMQLKIETYTKV
ncbi:hypothetical protein KEJ27_10275, partial [Candidatus Bathyarchaeota archaeon]|nr:hypothetical protein [Candidatus Bathyarchaeota archaeon]